MIRPQYKGYISESDSDSETDSTISSSSTGSTNSSPRNSIVENFEGQDFTKLAKGLATDTSINPKVNTAGVNPPPPELGYDIANGIPSFKSLVEPPDPSGNVLGLEFTSVSVSNIIMVDSRNRDRTAYPQPTNLTVRLPRICTRISAFNIVQIKLLSAFFYFRADKNNLDISIHEFGRSIVVKGQTIDQIIKNYIREGTYDINSLMAEITIQLNLTPVFYDYPGGFQDFAKKFAVTGDTSLNFNYPGDTYYDSLLDAYIPNPTMDLIISKYFAQRYAGLTTYTTDNVKIAYYYPVLKEIILDNSYDKALLNLTLTTSLPYLNPDETVESRVIYTFQGLYDPVILELANNNVTLLDEYRLNHTFRFYLINKYNVYSEAQSNRIIFQCPSLNTSLVNLLNAKRAQLFAEQLNIYGITAEQLANINTNNALLFAVINDMLTLYQQYIAIYFGISFNSFSFDYLLNPFLTLPIRDAYNAIGVNTNFNATNQSLTTSDILKNFRIGAPQYWNRMKNLSDNTIAYMNPVLPTETPDKGINLNTWNLDLDDQDYTNQLVKTNVLDPDNPNVTTIGNFYTNRRTQYADLVIPIEAAKYTVFRFKSPVRQTLKVETIPRPTKYRYPLYNQQAYDISHQLIFDNSYCFIQNSGNVKMDVSSNEFNANYILPIPGFSTPSVTAPFGVSYASSLAYWGFKTYTLSVLETRQFYEFYTPYPPAYTSCNAPAYTYPMQLTMAHSDPNAKFASPLVMFLYQDRGGFMADVSGNRVENPRNYIKAVSSYTDVSSVSISFTAYAAKHYYILTRSLDVSFATETYRVIPSFPSSTAFTALTSSIVGFNPVADPTLNLNNYNYAQNADPAFIKLPIASTLYPLPSIDPTTSSLQFLNPLMGYDANDVSTDLTNYNGFISNVAQSNVVPNATLRIDPANGFVFQAKTPYDPVSQLYFTSNSSNAILYPYGTGVYSTTTIANRQASIVHWYGNTFIPPVENQVLFPPESLAYTYIPPFTGSYPVNSTISGYSYVNRLDVSGNPYLGGSNFLNLGEGVMGIGFVPDQGVWDIDRFMFKSAFITADPAIDPNLQIKRIGIFPASYTSNRNLGDFTLDGALAVLDFKSSITYNSSNLNFGYDLVGGTFYEFTRSSSSAYTVGSNSYLYGYSQNAYEYNFDVNAFYVAVPFSGLSNAMYYYGLVGSAVPYPKYSQVKIVDSAPSPEGPVSPPFNKSFFLPGNPLLGANTQYGPPSGYTVSQSQYEQSMPIGTSAIFYANTYPINSVVTPYKPWTPFSFTPTEVVADCSGYILVKDSVYRVYSYTSLTSTLSFHEQYQFTLDQVFPISSNINYLGIAANESNIAFFGLSNAQPSSFLYIRTLNPKTGAIQQTYSEVSPVAFQSNASLYKALYNNLGGYTLSANVYDSNTTTVKPIVISRPFQGSSTLVTFSEHISDPSIAYFDIAQSPKEIYGQFWVFPQKTGLPAPIQEGFNDFAFVNPNQLHVSPDPGKYMASYISGSSAKYATITPYSLSNTSQSTFRSPIVIRDVAKDRVFMLSDSAPTKFFETTFTVGSADPTLTESVYDFPIAPTNIYAGASGASWALEGNTLYGNRFDSADAPKRITQTWQIFYPVQRIVFHQIAKNFNLLEDLRGLTYAEYPHTAIAVYDNSHNITNDTNLKWGLESASNFNTADFAYAGTYFNAYLYAVPLADNRATNDFYYMTVRNYSPTEKSQVLLRVSAPNRYTFGYITPMDLSGEISTAKYVSTTNDYRYTYYWDNRYVNSILGFDSNFIIDSNGKTFGGGVIEGFGGSNISSIAGFKEYYGQMRVLYNQYSTQVTLASTIQANINAGIVNFIQSDLKYIIPPYAQSRQRYADPLRFSIKWKTPLYPAYLKLIEEWGLGWNLGFIKADTDYQTIQKGASFFKILDDFINLRLNPELDMNRMDTTLQENLSVTHEPTGTTKSFFGKLLLANFGSYAQTLISNPISFANPLDRLDRITFQWVNTVGAIINNNDCEWNAVISITETTEIVKRPTIPLIAP